MGQGSARQKHKRKNRTKKSFIIKYKEYKIPQQGESDYSNKIQEE